jgi:hypothetical protein
MDISCVCSLHKFPNFDIRVFLPSLFLCVKQVLPDRAVSVSTQTVTSTYFEEISVGTADDSDDTQSEDDNENVLSDYRYYMHDKNKKEVHCASCCMT